MKKIINSVIAIVFLLLADQYTKYLAVIKLKNQPARELIPGVFEFHYLENRGAAFGSLQGKQLLLLFVTIIALVVVTYIYVKIPEGKRYRWLRGTMLLLFAGAVGNMIDRVVNHFVVDFLYFKMINFPIFNVADCYVTISACLLVFLILFVYKEEELQFLGKNKGTDQ